MEWNIVPLLKRDFGFFDRQRSLFPDWVHVFDNDWKLMDFDTSWKQFDEELERHRKDMFKLVSQEHGPSLMDVERPFVTDPDGNRKMALRFDVSQFKPEEITVKTTEGRLVVHAKHTEESPGQKVHREFTRDYTLPKEVDPAALKSTLSEDGVLQVEAPAPPAVEAPKEFLIPIEKL